MLNGQIYLERGGHGDGCPMTPKHILSILDWGLPVYEGLYVVVAAGSGYYMVGLAAICWGLWKARNDICLGTRKSGPLLKLFAPLAHS